jgi:hypothetical protein
MEKTWPQKRPDGGGKKKEKEREISEALVCLQVGR